MNKKLLYVILIIFLIYYILQNNVIEHVKDNFNKKCKVMFNKKCIAMFNEECKTSFSDVVETVNKLDEYGYICEDQYGQLKICDNDDIEKKILTKENCKKYNEEEEKILRYNKIYHIKNSSLEWYVQTCNDNDYIGWDCNKNNEKNVVQASKNNSESQFIFINENNKDSKDAIKQGDKFYIKCVDPNDYYIYACGANRDAYCSFGLNISAGTAGADLWSFKTKDKEDGYTFNIGDKFLIINMTHNEKSLHDCGNAQKKIQIYDINTQKMKDVSSNNESSFENDSVCGHNIGVRPYQSKEKFKDNDYKWTIENIN